LQERMLCAILMKLSAWDWIDAGGVTSLRTSLVHKLAEKAKSTFIKDSNDVPRLVALLCVNEPSLPYPIKKVMIKTALANRQFYEKERKEFAPDLYSLEKTCRR